jgi:hypothetical protein
MQIVGDPEFIKQDELYIGPQTIYPKGILRDLPNQYVPGTQSLSMDESEIYCYVTFKTPTDFNDDTGMYDLTNTNQFSVSEFSGFYRIYTVTSEFKGGKFTQTLELIRQPRQAPINQSSSTNTNAQSKGDAQRKKDDKAAQQAGNPKSKAKNASPSVDPNATGSGQGQNSNGPDGDAAKNSKKPAPTASTIYTPPTALQQLLNNNKKITYNDINSGD